MVPQQGEKLPIRSDFIVLVRRGFVRIVSTGLAIPLLSTLSACGDGNSEKLATINHDFNGNYELYSYRAQPSDEIKQAEALSKKLYGRLLADIKSPKTIFVCTWRDLRHNTQKDSQPKEVFLTCNFAPRPVENPRSLAKMAQIYNTIDRADLKATWKLDSGNYRLTRFALETNAKRKSFHSKNREADLSEIQVVQKNMNFPKDHQSMFQFNLRSTLPSRWKPGAEEGTPRVTATISGTAEPMPKWMNY